MLAYHAAAARLALSVAAKRGLCLGYPRRRSRASSLRALPGQNLFIMSTTVREPGTLQPVVGAAARGGRAVSAADHLSERGAGPHRAKRIAFRGRSAAYRVERSKAGGNCRILNDSGTRR